MTFEHLLLGIETTGHAGRRDKTMLLLDIAGVVGALARRASREQ